jgi:hypothetical protein
MRREGHAFSSSSVFCVNGISLSSVASTGDQCMRAGSFRRINIRLSCLQVPHPQLVPLGGNDFQILQDHEKMISASRAILTGVALQINYALVIFALRYLIDAWLFRQTQRQSQPFIVAVTK